MAAPLARCHKCKESRRYIYATRAPVCGECLNRKVEAAFISPLRRALREQHNSVIIIDESIHPDLLEAFKPHYLSILSQNNQIILMPPVSMIEDQLVRSFTTLTVEQRRRLKTQLRLALYSALACGNGIVIRCRPASLRASDIFSHLLSGDRTMHETFSDFKLIPLVGDLEPMEIAALRHHLISQRLQITDHSESCQPVIPFEFQPASLENGSWIKNVERSSISIINAFMECIPSEMPSAISNVNATAKKIMSNEREAESTCDLCTVNFTNFKDAQWLPSGLDAKADLCHLCSLASENLDLDLIKKIVRTIAHDVKTAVTDRGLVNTLGDSGNAVAFAAIDS